MGKRNLFPEFRKDPTSGLWVIISPERQNRFVEDSTHDPKNILRDCPFCPGNESQTPPEIEVVRPESFSNSKAKWLIRVVPNKFPALTETSRTFDSHNSIYSSVPGTGIHEVVIESPDHFANLMSMTTNELVLILKVFRKRIREIKKNKLLKYVLIFKNSGRKAGASLSHPHSQIVATPMLSTKTAFEQDHLRKYYAKNSSCLYCDLITNELIDNARIVEMSKEFVAFEPFASRFPFETWLISKNHSPSFEEETEDRLREFARLLKSVFSRLFRVLKLEDYNFLIHTAPLQEDNAHYFHWHAEILPCMANIAGFERGAGFYINEIFPEEAAMKLRDV